MGIQAFNINMILSQIANSKGSNNTQKKVSSKKNTTNSQHWMEEEQETEQTNALRPSTLTQYVGQKTLVRQLRLILESAQIRGNLPEHTLFYGQPGLGKTTIASLIANELGCHFKIISAPALQKTGDIVSLLLNTEERTVIFIDEIHRLRTPLEETLYSAMEDKKIDLLVGKGNGTNTVRMDLPDFVLIGATTQLGKISKPLKDRFPNIFLLEPYSQSDMLELIERSCNLLKLKLDNQAMLAVCRRSRGIPRVANNLLKRLVDFQTVHKLKLISATEAEDFLTELGVFKDGLTVHDMKYLSILLDGTVSLKTIADMLQEDPDTIEYVTEPHLTHLGLIAKSSGGRVLTVKGREYILRNKKLE